MRFGNDSVLKRVNRNFSLNSNRNITEIFVKFGFKFFIDPEKFKYFWGGFRFAGLRYQFISNVSVTCVTSK